MSPVLLKHPPSQPSTLPHTPPTHHTCPQLPYLWWRERWWWSCFWIGWLGLLQELMTGRCWVEDGIGRETYYIPSLGYFIWNPWNGGWRLMDSMEWLCLPPPSHHTLPSHSLTPSFPPPLYYTTPLPPLSLTPPLYYTTPLPPHSPFSLRLVKYFLCIVM